MVEVAKIRATPDPPAAGASGGGSEERLAAVEQQMAALNARVDCLATKEDIQKLKVWVLGGVIAAMVLGIGIAIGLARLLA